MENDKPRVIRPGEIFTSPARIRDLQENEQNPWKRKPISNVIRITDQDGFKTMRTNGLGNRVLRNRVTVSSMPTGYGEMVLEKKSFASLIRETLHRFFNLR